MVANFLAPALGAPPVKHGISAGLLHVEQISATDENTASVTLGQTVNTFRLGSFNRGDYTVRIGPGVDASQDEALGILMTSVAENGRDNFGTNGYPTSSFATNGSGTYRIVSFLGTGGAGSAIEYNVNVAGAWFPFDRFPGGFARNSTGANGGTNDLFTGSPGLVLGTHFKGISGGQSVVDLRSFGIDSRTDGILLVTHAKDENNFALSQANTADGTWNVFVRDNAQPTFGNYEQDPVAFVFIPRTNTAVISGRFRANASIDMFSGSSPQFSVTTLGTGRWELQIAGHSPTNGVLIISPEGGGALNGDNIVSYQPLANGQGWEIQSRDTPVNGLQTPTGEHVASFVYIPEPLPGFNVSPTSGLTTSGSGQNASFDVSLQAPPAAPVIINLTSSRNSLGVPSPSTLIFTDSNWYKAQTVTVSGQSTAQDGIYKIELLPASSADARYQGLDPEDVFVVSLAARAFLVSPTNNALYANTSPLLQVNISNSAPGNLSVVFRGRPAPTLLPGPDFAIAVLPDTQNYSAERYGGTKEMFISQVEWIITNRVSRNIAYVTQLGDIVNDGDIYLGLPNLTQWRNATNAMYRQENPVRTQLPHGIAYGVAVGNHEMEPIGDPTGTTIFYNQYFGIDHFSGRPYYAGHYGTNNNNHFDFFTAGGLDFIVLYFEYDNNANPAVLAWASAVLSTNAHRRAILVTHNFGNTDTPLSFSAQGAAIYNALKTHTNIFMMLGGHITGQGAREDSFNGNIIRTFVQDYQSWTNGGNGFMRLYEFSPSNNVVVVQTFSSWTGEYRTDEESEFYFPYDMEPTGSGAAGPYSLVGTYTNVAPGTMLACPWPGLEPNKAYEWYVTVTDEAGRSVTSPTWRFTTTGVNSPPVVGNVALTLTGDSPTNIVLAATDINGDPVTFQIHATPLHGLLRDFQPNTGAITYWPTHGFAGYDRFTFSASDGQASSFVASMNLTVVAPADTNANGLPDWWETAFGISDPNTDADKDGQSDSAEYAANTNPTNAASALRILSAAVQNEGAFTVTWSSIGGVRYRVQIAANPSGQYTDIVRPIEEEMDAAPNGAPSTQTFSHVDGNAPPGGRLYRIKVVR